VVHIAVAAVHLEHLVEAGQQGEEAGAPPVLDLGTVGRLSLNEAGAVVLQVDCQGSDL
jgi:hypothetical protein